MLKWLRMWGLQDLGFRALKVRIGGHRVSVGLTHMLLSSSFWGFPYRIRNINKKRELAWSLWV